MDAPATCSFCGRQLPVDAAIEAGWEPGYYADYDTWRNAPVCGRCLKAEMVYDGTSEEFFVVGWWNAVHAR